MAAATSQPSAPITLATGYSTKVVAGWVGYDYEGNKLGSATLTPTAQFTSSKFQGTLSDGSVTLSCDAASLTDSAGQAITIGHSPTQNNFTMVMVFRTRAEYSAAVVVRSGSSFIPIWRSSGGYRIRVNGVTSAITGSMPQNATIKYVITSNASGIWAYVDGVQVINMAASVATTTGVNTYIYEDIANAGGSHDLDVALFAIFNQGVTQAEAQSLSSNPWQMFEVGGGAPATQSFNYTSTGGVVTTGGAVMQRSKSFAPQSGFLLGGVAITQKAILRAYTPSGGIQLGGAGSSGRGEARGATGGFGVFGGASVTALAFIPPAVIIPGAVPLNDLIVQKLRATLQKDGAYGDLYNENYYWRNFGITKTALNDVKKAVLKDLGYAGQMNNMEQQYWENL